MSRCKIECAETAKNPRTSGVNAAAVKVRVCGRRQTCRVRHITAQVTTVHIPYAGTQVREYCPSARHLHSAARPGTGIWVREYCHREKTAAKHRTRSADRRSDGKPCAWADAATARQRRARAGARTPYPHRKAGRLIPDAEMRVRGFGHPSFPTLCRRGHGRRIPPQILPFASPRIGRTTENPKKPPAAIDKR